MGCRNIAKLVELEGQLFDELMSQSRLDDAIEVIKRQLLLLEHHLLKDRHDKRNRKKVRLA